MPPKNSENPDDSASRQPPGRPGDDSQRQAHACEDRQVRDRHHPDEMRAPQKEALLEQLDAYDQRQRARAGRWPVRK